MLCLFLPLSTRTGRTLYFITAGPITWCWAFNNCLHYMYHLPNYSAVSHYFLFIQSSDNKYWAYSMSQAMESHIWTKQQWPLPSFCLQTSSLEEICPKVNLWLISFNQFILSNCQNHKLFSYYIYALFKNKITQSIIAVAFMV